MNTPKFQLNKEILRALALALTVAGISTVQTTPPDLTASGVIADIDRSDTFNLGPTGLRGWTHCKRPVPSHRSFPSHRNTALLTPDFPTVLTRKQIPSSQYS